MNTENLLKPFFLRLESTPLSEISEKTGLSKPAIRAVLKSKNMRLDTFIKVASSLGFSLNLNDISSTQSLGDLFEHQFKNEPKETEPKQEALVLKPEAKTESQAFRINEEDISNAVIKSNGNLENLKEALKMVYLGCKQKDTDFSKVIRACEENGCIGLLGFCVSVIELWKQDSRILKLKESVFREFIQKDHRQTINLTGDQRYQLDSSKTKNLSSVGLMWGVAILYFKLSEFVEALDTNGP